MDKSTGRRGCFAAALVDWPRHPRMSPSLNRFRKTAEDHRAEVAKLASRMKPFARIDRDWLPIEWHESMRRKYERAARYPWLPVGPDPPEPE